jgi:mono/diheme cytochrome c family protein
MRVSFGVGVTAALGVALALAGTSSTFAAHKMAAHGKPAGSAALIAKGKQLSSEKHCNSCHAADLKGKPGFSPSLHASGVLKEYNPTTWARVMDTGVTNDGGKVKPPMPVYHLSKADSAALWTYFKTLK